MSLTNEELKLLYENKDILPLLIKNKKDYNFNNNNLTETEKSKSKEDKNLDLIKNISFENNLLNLFLKGNKRPTIKKEFPKVQYNENNKNNTSTNYDHIKYTKNLYNNKNSLSKSQIYKKIIMKKNSEEKSDEDNIKNDLIFLGYKNKLNANQYNQEEIKKGEKIWEKWIFDVINKNKNKNVNNNDNINNNINEELYNHIIKKEEEEFKKIIIKKILRQNSFKVENNINKKGEDDFILSNEVKNNIKNKNINKSQIINEERVFEKIKKKFLIDIFSYITTPQGKLNLKLIMNIDEKNNINKKVNTNQIKNKILLQSFLPKKLVKNSNLIPNPYIIKEGKNNDSEEEEKEELDEDYDTNDINNLLNNLDFLPISLKKFFLEKYKIMDVSRNSKINLDFKNTSKGKRNINKKKIIQKKINIKVDNHNQKMVNNFLSNHKNKKNKDNERNISNKKKPKINPKNKPKEKPNIIIPMKKEEPRIINLFGINIIIKKDKPPIQYLQEYMQKNGIKKSEELKSRVILKNKITKLISKLQLEKKKKNRRTKTLNNKSLLKILDINYDSNNLIKLAHKGTSSEFITSQKKLKYFDTSLIKSRKDVEKRKMQILLKFKNDMEYKAMTGDIDEADLNIYSKLEERIDKLMDLININEYVAKMEDYIGEFQEEINMRQKSRNDEKRINGFIEKLKEEINFKLVKKKYMLKRFGKITNFKKVNNIGKLNDI